MTPSTRGPSPDRRPLLLFYCQHSLGLGHLSRSMALSASLSEGYRVVLLCGGKLPQGVEVPADVEIVQLPPLGADGNGKLVSRDSRRTLARAQQLRRDLILRTYRSLRPDVVLIEFFPFGKKRFTGELLPLLEETRRTGSAPPLVMCSIRDILVSRGAEQQEHDDNAAALLDGYFDGVLVHSDSRFARLEDSFHPSVRPRTPFYYTGFVVPEGSPPPGPRPRNPEVIVSAGGGIVGEPLLRAAVRAHRLTGFGDDVRMKVVAGPFLPPESWRSLRAKARGQPGLTMKRWVPDLLAELRAAAASISQCGYNTALDILRARVPALVVPFSEGEENEQTRRAHRLRELGAVHVLEAADLEPSRLAAEIRTLLEFRPSRVELDLRGGPNSLRILADLSGRAAVGAG